MHASAMARREKTVDLNYIDTEFSSGDSKKMKSKRYQEENNNEVDELSKELSEMGCIVDAVKRPNICVENCVYDGSESEHEKSEVYNEEDAYSDEFEEDKSEEEESVKSLPKSEMSDTSREQTLRSSVKLTKSQSSMSSNKPPVSVSGRSTSFGSISGLKTRRINMSFTNERLREIERHNHILLTKILSARNARKCSIPPREQALRRPVPSAAVCRKSQQRQIDHDNMILLKKIQRAKSSACSIRR
ncbi:uncharacterized protein LOC113506394 [Trichoplusia ni]|uniref:Uncharacterized protein LOC113506388 n=1 Tax=Trichoplusia ni TaxID=7111 RepID=A0A7E5WW37_TRINI|nr:uncharacterized protein LOC113506388 [Trichoplusia ni]XP_026745037.1 uncharacterized protein LOC113506388 [Trichoplusia ni]XP_026745038.1 uncharacterized protein LOC113506388 [Trichoplusia ni]XP_026745039.1 uncharacterized protein LOC113506388 [Trichoplusia ni]XP_026745040.1 uncharacterized protein LOC113506388 [Trichoplusia ni]XP_026745041.1 uncharacterized protein LOC113506388 [Trichoplusia ni]XP_026745044.1 uncharacterized protein LOC113506394 [Trichoplusia ni]XP_026745045.1 uncharacte